MSIKISKNSVWEKPRIEEFLDSADIPMRLAGIDLDGAPFICSLWYQYSDGCLWAATHKSAYILRALATGDPVGFEIATNDYPYMGVRGKGTVVISTEKGGEILQSLIDRYLGETNRKLAKWLLSRAEDEYVLRIQVHQINSWDYSHRMES